MKPARMPTTFLPEGWTAKRMAERLQELGFELDYGENTAHWSFSKMQDAVPGVKLPWDADGFYFLTERLKKSLTYEYLEGIRFPESYPEYDEDGLLNRGLADYLHGVILAMDRMATVELARALRASGRIDGWLYAAASHKRQCGEIVEAAEKACAEMNEWKPLKAWLESKRNLALIYKRICADRLTKYDRIELIGSGDYVRGKKEEE